MFKESQIPFGNKRKVESGFAPVFNFPGYKNRILTGPDDFLYFDPGQTVSQAKFLFSL